MNVRFEIRIYEPTTHKGTRIRIKWWNGTFSRYYPMDYYYNYPIDYALFILEADYGWESRQIRDIVWKEKESKYIIFAERE